MVISSQIAVSLTTTEAVTNGFGTTNVPDPLTAALPFTNGTGSAQVDLHWELPSVTLAAGASVTYTLSALTDLLGRTVALARVRLLVIQVLARTAGDYLTVGDPTDSLSHPWSAPMGGATQSFRVYDLEAKAATLTDGFAVVASTTDQLLITNSGSHPITFAIALVGTSV